MSSEKLDTFLTQPLIVLFFLFEYEQFVDNLKQLLMFLINGTDTNVILFVPFNLGCHELPPLPQYFFTPTAVFLTKFFFYII